MVKRDMDLYKCTIADLAYYETFQLFRDRLLELGYGIKCNGSRINAIQSGMMGYCEKNISCEIR